MTPDTLPRIEHGQGDRKAFPIPWLFDIGRFCMSLDALPRSVLDSDVNKHTHSGGGGGGGGGGGRGGGRGGRGERSGDRGDRGGDRGGGRGGDRGGGDRGGPAPQLADPRGSVRSPAANGANGPAGGPGRSGPPGMLGGPPRGGASAGPPEPDFLAARGTMKVLAGGQPGGGGGGPDLSMARTPRGGGGMGTPMNRGGGGYGSARGGYGDMSDPRGSRVQADIIAPQPELQRSENAWQRKREDDDEVQTKIKQVRSLLNKLTLEKFEKIYGQIKDIEITSIHVLYGIVAEVFQKSLSEANFAPMYADLCARLSRDKLNLSEELLKTPEEEKKALSFRRRLIKNCQMEFERFANEETIMSDLKALEEADTLSTETLMTVVEKAREKKSAAMSEFVDKLETIAKQEVIEQKDIGVVIQRAKQRMLGNVKFIGELFKQKLIPEKIIHMECIQRLTRISLEKKEDDVIEALVQLMTTTGKILASNASARSHMDAYFKEFTLLSRDPDIPTRIRFLLKDLLDLRAANWHQRREETKAKTLAEIHEDIEKEERAKEAASRGGGGSRGFGGGRDRRDRDRGGPPPARGINMHVPLSARGGGGNTFGGGPSGGDRRDGGGGGGRPGGGIRPRPLGGSMGGSGDVRVASRSSGPPSNSFSMLAESPSSGSDARHGSADRSDFSGSARGGGRVLSGGAGGSPSTPSGGGSVAGDANDKTPSGGMSTENLERKAKAILGEFDSTNDMKEATECVAEEVPEAKRGEFVAAIMRRVLDMRPNQRLGPLGLLEYIARAGTVPNTAFIAGFTETLDELTDLCIDDPQANIFVGKFIGRLAAAGAFEPADGGSGPSSGSTAAASKDRGAKTRGLGFLSTAVGKLQEEDARATLQLVCAVFSGFKQGLLSPPVGPPPDTPNKPAAASEVEADAVSRGVCQALGLDVTALAKAIGDRGDMALQSALDALGVHFLVPLRAVGKEIAMRLAPARAGAPTPMAANAATALATSTVAWCNQRVDAATRASPAFVRLLARSALAAACAVTASAGGKDDGSPPLTVDAVTTEKALLVSLVAPLLAPYTGTSQPLAEAVLLEVQAFCYASGFPPGVVAASGVRGPSLVSRLFESFYDTDVVSEEAASAWKELIVTGDDERGKTEALVQTRGWFDWLAEAEEEDDEEEDAAAAAAKRGGSSASAPPAPGAVANRT